MKRLRAHSLFGPNLAGYPHELEIGDVTSDPELRLVKCLPVLRVGGRDVDAPLPRAFHERALREGLEADRAASTGDAG